MTPFLTHGPCSLPPSPSSQEGLSDSTQSSIHLPVHPPSFASSRSGVFPAEERTVFLTGDHRAPLLKPKSVKAPLYLSIIVRSASRDDSNKQPVPILSPSCTIGSLTWGIEDLVNQALQDEPNPDPLLARYNRYPSPSVPGCTWLWVSSLDSLIPKEISFLDSASDPPLVPPTLSPSLKIILRFSGLAGGGLFPPSDTLLG
ncbi:hypothetical protein CRENBAI_017909 [Crenichthys baileyi]|uniref:Uncharacterized protein n=1 Tax=Crenichthys baileyi TaxID=28760 RepID=A0AAV9SKB7_9TELE